MVSRCPTRCPDTPRHWRSYPGAHRVIWHPCVMPTDMERTPPAWTVAVWQSCWKWSLGSRQTLMRSGHRCKRESSPTRPPYKFPITTVRTRAHLKRASRTILRSVCSWWAVVFRGAPVDFPDSRQAVAPCLRGGGGVINGFSGHTNPSNVSPWRRPSRASAKIPCLVQIGVGRGIA